MAHNITTTSYIKHIDIRYKYVNEYVENRIVKSIFMESAENDSNIVTKILSTELHKKHSKESGSWEAWKVLVLKIYEVKRKSIRDVVSASSIQFKNISKAGGSPIWLQ